MSDWIFKDGLWQPENPQPPGYPWIVQRQDAIDDLRNLVIEFGALNLFDPLEDIRFCPPLLEPENPYVTLLKLRITLLMELVIIKRYLRMYEMLLRQQEASRIGRLLWLGVKLVMGWD